MIRRTLVVTGALFGMLSVILGAFGAHALKPALIESGHLDTWEKGVDYMMWHALALISVGLLLRSQPPRAAKTMVWAGFAWIGGILLFSGSLFGLSLGGPGWLGPVTPLGGLLFLTGWVFLAWAGRRLQDS
jgi:uncharacterized membrane protein YgdD (TMEM256/DUF423 family)